MEILDVCFKQVDFGQLFCILTNFVVLNGHFTFFNVLISGYVFPEALLFLQEALVEVLLQPIVRGQRVLFRPFTHS